MNRKHIAIVLLIAMLVLILPVNAATPEADIVQSRTITFEDGSYAELVVNEGPATRAGQTKSGSKAYYYYTSDDVLVWTVTVYGTFRYDGTYTSCTYATCESATYGDGWSCSSKEAHTSGNNAVCNATMVRKVLGITVDTRNINLTLTCDKNGNLS